jgi:hypothetical protein
MNLFEVGQVGAMHLLCSYESIVQTKEAHQNLGNAYQLVEPRETVSATE